MSKRQNGRALLAGQVEAALAAHADDPAAAVAAVRAALDAPRSAVGLEVLAWPPGGPQVIGRVVAESPEGLVVASGTTCVVVPVELVSVRRPQPAELACPHCGCPERLSEICVYEGKTPSQPTLDALGRRDAGGQGETEILWDSCMERCWWCDECEREIEGLDALVVAVAVQAGTAQAA